MRNARGLLLAVQILLLLSIAGTAAAQDNPDLDAAKSAFKAGQQFLKMERYADAIVEFNKAYAITKDGLVKGQVALAYEKAGDYESALSSIRAYRDALPESDRVSVDALIKKYERLIAEGKSTRLVLPSERPPDDVPSPSDVEQQNDPLAPALATDGGQGKGRFWTWIAAGTAAALGVGALVVGLSAKSKFDELDDRCGKNQLGVCSEDDVSSVETRALVTDILWPMAVAAGITAGVLFFIEKPAGKNATHEDKDDLLDDEEEEDDLVKDWRVTPVAGAGVYGVGAQLTY